MSLLETAFLMGLFIGEPSGLLNEQRHQLECRNQSGGKKTSSNMLLIARVLAGI